jgi:type 1 fimbria pilin
MKKIMIGAAGFLLWMAGASYAGDEEIRTFRGEVADNQCALNIHSLTHSHQEMLKSKSMGGDSAACAQYCTKYLGGFFVLSVKKDAYRLDDQIEAQKFAGKRVRISGTLDVKTKTIHVTKIEADE